MNPGPPHNDDLPLVELAELGEDPSPEFIARVRASIHRRTTVAQCASLSWYLPKSVATELAGLLRHVLTSLAGSEKPRP